MVSHVTYALRVSSLHTGDGDVTHTSRGVSTGPSRRGVAHRTHLGVVAASPPDAPSVSAVPAVMPRSALHPS